jgi:nucleotide-binding universal stress UspA family protein
MKILVPVDGSAPGNRAVAYALALLRGREDGEVLLLNVQGIETLDVSDISAVISVEADRATANSQSERALKKAVSLCRESGVRFDTAVEIGPVVDTIEEVARRRHVDQIVMGTRGLGALGRLILGSVATRVVQRSRVPVTLVK